MIPNLSKRAFLIIAISISFSNASNMPLTDNTKQTKLNEIQEKFAKLELSFGGRIGISAINTENNEHIQYRADERFPFCSTSKVIVVGAILNKSKKPPSILKKNIIYSQKELDNSGYHPITEKHIATGMSISELSEAALQYSDNAAMNFLIKQLGGTEAVTAYARSIGDKMFRLDRNEPELNTAIPNDVRDTTTPSAMEKSLQSLIIGNALLPSQREQLQVWLKNNTTGNATIRAGVPNGWIVGDKTGSGDYGTRNDIGIIWPAKCLPIVVAIYTTQNKKDAISRDDVIASATRILISEFALNDKCIVLKNKMEYK